MQASRGRSARGSRFRQCSAAAAVCVATALHRRSDARNIRRRVNKYVARAARVLYKHTRTRARSVCLFRGAKCSVVLVSVCHGMVDMDGGCLVYVCILLVRLVCCCCCWCADPGRRTNNAHACNTGLSKHTTRNAPNAERRSHTFGVYRT